jgi:hypothetical protein
MPSNKGKKAMKKGGKGEGRKGPSKKSLRNQTVLDTIWDTEDNAELHPLLSWGRVCKIHSIGRSPRVEVHAYAHGILPASVLAEKQIASLLSSLARSYPAVLVEYMPAKNCYNILAVVDDDTDEGRDAISKFTIKLPSAGEPPARIPRVGELPDDGIIFDDGLSVEDEEEEEVDLEDL